MNDTEQLFMIAAVWALIAAAVARFIPNWPGRIAFFAIAVGLLFWELPFGYYNFAMLCREEGRLQIFETIPPQTNICLDYPIEDIAERVLKTGFDSVEARGRAGDIRRYVSKGAVDRREDRQDRITAGYCITSVSNIPLPWRILRHDHLIRGATDGHIVARQSRFSWAGMWWQEAARPVLGRGGDCSENMNRTFEAVRNGARKEGG
jgi:hypothetical protein